MSPTPTDIHLIPAQPHALDPDAEGCLALADACHCGEFFETCRGCGAPRCPACEPIRDEDCLWAV